MSTDLQLGYYCVPPLARACPTAGPRTAGSHFHATPSSNFGSHNYTWPLLLINNRSSRSQLLILSSLASDGRLPRRICKEPVQSVHTPLQLNIIALQRLRHRSTPKWNLHHRTSHECLSHLRALKLLLSAQQRLPMSAKLQHISLSSHP